MREKFKKEGVFFLLTLKTYQIDACPVLFQSNSTIFTGVTILNKNKQLTFS